MSAFGSGSAPSTGPHLIVRALIYAAGLGEPHANRKGFSMEIAAVGTGLIILIIIIVLAVIGLLTVLRRVL